jgi:uncharacterized protein involved in exopolysaccharide biosynthesis
MNDSWFDTFPSDDYIRSAWRYRRWIVGLTLLVTVSTYVGNRAMTPTFETSATAMVFGGAADSPTPKATMKALLESPGIAQQVLQELHLDKDPLRLNAERLIRTSLSIEDVLYAPVLRVKIRLADASLSALILNRLMERAAAVSQEVNRSSAAAEVGDMNDRLRASRQRLEQTHTNLVGVAAARSLQLETGLATKAATLTLDLETTRLQIRTLEDRVQHNLDAAVDRALNEERVAAHRDMAEILRRRAELREKLRAAVRSDPNLRRLEDDCEAAEREYDSLSIPYVAALREQLQLRPVAEAPIPVEPVEPHTAANTAIASLASFVVFSLVFASSGPRRNLPQGRVSR